MKYLNIACGLLMILFAGVQFNDPDGLLWAAIYLVPAIWAGILAFRPHLIQNTLPFGLLGLSAAAELIGVLYYWPTTPGFWRQDVWWKTETVREGMGIMIAAVVVLIALATAVRNRAAAHKAG